MPLRNCSYLGQNCSIVKTFLQTSSTGQIWARPGIMIHPGLPPAHGGDRVHHPAPGHGQTQGALGEAAGLTWKATRLKKIGAGYAPRPGSSAKTGSRIEPANLYFNGQGAGPKGYLVLRWMSNSSISVSKSLLKLGGSVGSVIVSRR